MLQIIPGRFSWIIQRLLHGPVLGPVGSKLAVALDGQRG